MVDRMREKRLLSLSRCCAMGASIEALEPRLLLSAAKASAVTHAHHSHKTKKVVVPKHPAATKTTLPSASPTAIEVGAVSLPTPGDTPATSPFTPAEIRHFYGVDDVSFNGVTGDGSGETIAIVDAYNQPDLVDSTDPSFDTSDLHMFDELFDLPDPPSFTKVDEYGGTDVPTTYDAGWAAETSLDVEWAHAMAPMANIVLVECNSDTYDDLLGYGAATAGRLANVVSMSFGGPEFYGDSEYDSVFADASTSAKGITYVASAGDTGADGTGYPAFSPDVVSVGGTSITTSDSQASYGSETVWNDNYGSTGGGYSSVTEKPDYQSQIAMGGDARVVPDVAFDADPATGVYVYDSSENPEKHLYGYGGTSVGAPCWAGIIAIADQGRALLGLPSLDGPSQTLPRLYQLPSDAYHDITSGNNDGYSAGIGFDACTGWGTPVAQILIPDLAGGDTLTGQVFQDNNADGVYDGSDSPLAGQTVYLDLNHDGVQDADDPTAVTDADGDFTFADVLGGATSSILLADPSAGFVAVGSTAFSTSYGASQSVNDPQFPTAFSDTSGSAAYTLALDSTATTVQISVNGTLTYSAPASLAPSFSFSLTGTGDSLTVDGTNGNPVPAGGITFTGATSGDNLSVLGTVSGDDAFAVTSSSITFGSNPINFSNVSSLLLNPGAGTDSLEVDSGSVIIAAQNPGLGILTRNFSSIALASDTSLVFADAAAHTDRMLVVTSAISIGAGATLDLGGNDMIIHNGDLAALSGLLASGLNNGSWNGSGIASSAAASDATYRTALGILLNNAGAFGAANLFDGYAPSSSDVLIKYTYYGDANLDGQVDGSDYTLIDNGFNNQLTGWQNGDFNYDSTVDGSDYTLIDNVYNIQGSPL
jgi:hypothetical protein